MRIVSIRNAGSVLRRLIDRGAMATAKVDPAVRRIVRDVRRDGDRALRRYAVKFDGLAPGEALRVSSGEIERAWRESPASFREALRTAARNIRRFAEWQKPRSWRRSVAPGVRVGQVLRPLGSVGCYVPGGRYPLPSTLLMTAIPAQVAGVERIVVVSPRPARETLAAAALLGITEFYRIGGAQAIAALAYGPRSVPRVAKIVGPGNLYVTAAKKLVAFDCSIDMLAGPTEALIYSDTGEPAFLAADLVAQAEHDPETTCVFVTTRRRQAEAVAAAVRQQAAGNATAEQALARNGVILLARSRDEAVQIVNAIAPEHVTVDAANVDAIHSAGSIFVGEYSPQPAGDYCSGPNHVLPTGAAARWRGGLSVSDFLKVITVQELSRPGLARLAPSAVTLAEAEGLRGHAAAVRIRLPRVRRAYA